MKLGMFPPYRGLVGSIEYSYDDACYLGFIKHIDELVMYEAENTEKLYVEFQTAVDNYLGKQVGN